MKINSKYKLKVWFLSTLYGCFSIAYAVTNDTLVLPVRLSANLNYCYYTQCFEGKSEATVNLNVNKNDGFCYLAGFYNNGHDTTKSRVYLNDDGSWKIYYSLGKGAKTRATCILWDNKNNALCNATRCSGDGEAPSIGSKTLSA